MIRKIIHIEEEKCNGCGACAKACHEGAIGMVNGKARLLRDDYCDGLGDCLPNCPTGAITFVMREAAAYDHEAVQQNMAARGAAPQGCPGTLARQMAKKPETAAAGRAVNRLTTWPVQIKLANVRAPYFQDCDLLIAADCTAYAYANFHEDFMKDKVTLVGCPKLDAVDYSLKLTEIFRRNSIRSIRLARMEVPCCGGMEMAIRKAIADSGKEIPLEVTTISTEGAIL